MKIIVDNLAIHYQDEGKGPAAVLLHGWAANLNTFDALAGELQKKYRVIRLDWPGFGGSEQAAKDWSVTEYAVFLKTFLGKVKVNPDVLIGHSFGGRVAMKSVANGLLKPKKLILLDTGGIKTSSSVRNKALKGLAKLAKAATAMTPNLRRRLRRRAYQAIGSTDYLTAGTMTKTFLKIINEDLQAAAAKVPAPTLLIWGERDTETPVSDGRRFAELIPNARLEILPAGHFVYLDQPAEVTKLITAFLK